MSLWRKRKDVHHDEQKPAKLFSLSIESPDLSIKSKKIDEDDDIQAYVKPWVGLTEEEIKECFTITPDQYLHWHIYKRVEQLLKSKNT